MRRKESGSKKVPFGFVELPAGRSQKKPRTTGLTMVADFGLPYMQVADLVKMADRYIDLAKIAVGTSRLYDLAYLRKKLALYRKHGFVAGPAFADYRPSDFNQFLQRALQP